MGAVRDRACDWGRRIDRLMRPPIGRRRELWDTSLYLLGISMVAYVLTTPPATVAVALSSPLRVVSEQQLGWGVTAAASVGVVASYGPRRWLDVGYIVPRIAAYFMCLNFLVGLALIAADGSVIGPWTLDFVVPDLTRVQEVQAERAAFIYALIFGWAARRLARDNRAWWEIGHPPGPPTPQRRGSGSGS